MMLLLASPLSAVYCLIAASLLYLTFKILVPYFRDPLNLRKYPAPNLLAALTPLWLLRATWSQRRSRIIHEEIKRLGDVIRVSPNQLIFNDPAAIKDIYGVLALSHGVAKDEFYDRLAGDAHDLVQLRDRAEHSERRKAIANAFAAKTVVNMEPVVRRSLLQLLVNIDKHIEAASPGEQPPINLRKWLNFFTLDVIGDTGFGLPLGFLEELADTTEAETEGGTRYRVTDMIDVLHRGTRYSVLMANITPYRLNRLLKNVIPKIRLLASRIGSTCTDDFENVCIRQLRKRIEKGQADRESGDFMDFILKDKTRSSDKLGAATQGERQFSYAKFRSLVADAQMVMNAGSDTTAAALTSTIWFLLQNPCALARLRQELAPLVPNRTSDGDLPSSAAASMFSYDAVKDLPYLRACIDESLRLRPPIAYQLPRLVSRPVKIAGRDILPGTVVAVAPYSVHRHPSLYRDPDEYRPERWIEFDEGFPNQRDDLRKYNIVFSQGSRACIGRHLAIFELQVLVATIVMRYDMELAEESKKELLIFDRFNSNPGPMYVKIKRRIPASL